MGCLASGRLFNRSNLFLRADGGDLGGAFFALKKMQNNSQFHRNTSFIKTSNTRITTYCNINTYFGFDSIRLQAPQTLTVFCKLGTICLYFKHPEQYEKPQLGHAFSLQNIENDLSQVIQLIFASNLRLIFFISFYLTICCYDSSVAMDQFKSIFLQIENLSSIIQ